MMSLTTILALVPMILGIGEGASLRAPMAIAVIGGMISSTLLTLVVIPALYRLIEGRRAVGKDVA
jgi:HAE1 family hydrophobic/amphiphilic exporter-1